MIKSIFIIVYIYGLLPLLIGTAVTLLAKRHVNLPQLYVSGYVIYLALFEVIVIWQTHNLASLTHLSRFWKVLTLILSVLALCSIAISIISIRKSHMSHARILPCFNRESWMIIGLTIVLTLLSIFFLVPHALDNTPELARMSLTNDSFFSLDPSTGAAYTDPSALPGYMHLFYAFGSTMTGIDVTTLIHLIIPIFLIPLFVCIYVSIARILFPDEEKKHDRFRFVCLISLFYFLMLPLEAHIALAPYRNIWNGITLATSCLLPLILVICLDLTRHFTFDNTKPVFLIANSVIGLICLTLAIKLCIPYGPVLCGLFVLATILIILAGILWRMRSDSKSDSITKGGEQS